MACANSRSASRISGLDASRPLIQPHAGLHFAIDERNPINLQLEVAHALFFDEQHFLVQPQVTPKADASVKPELDAVGVLPGSSRLMLAEKLEF